METNPLNHHTMFYEDQHKLAAYLERTGAAFEYQTLDMQKRWLLGGGVWTASEYVKAGNPIRPVLRYGLPSHLQSEIANPDNLTEEQICEGGKYRAVVNGERGNKGFQWWDKANGRWVVRQDSVGTLITPEGILTFRLPATVPWPDWEATQPDPKDARIAELEKANSKLSIWKDDMTTEYKKLERCFKEAGADVKRLEAQLATSPWRPMSEVPTEEDADATGCVISLYTKDQVSRVHIEKWSDGTLNIPCIAWMPVPKFPGWPDPLADLLKAHGVAVTPEILATLNAWKGVEK